MPVPSRVFFADEKLRLAYGKLEHGRTEERRLYRHLGQALTNLEKDAFCGFQVPKRLIPKAYRTAFGITNLWKYDLPGAWRLLYSVKGSEVAVLSIVLEWLSHKEYEKRFGYL